MAASVWMTPLMGRPVTPDCISLPRPLTTPVVSVWSSPKGLPMAYTRWPTWRVRLLPRGKGRSLAVDGTPRPFSTSFSTATSLSWSKPTTRAS